MLLTLNGSGEALAHPGPAWAPRFPGANCPQAATPTAHGSPGDSSSATWALELLKTLTGDSLLPEAKVPLELEACGALSRCFQIFFLNT